MNQPDLIPGLPPLPEPTPEPVPEEFDYIVVEVSRQQSTEVYMKVPRGWRPQFRDKGGVVKEAVNETVGSCDWYAYCTQGVEVENVSEVDADEANNYRVFDAAAYMKENNSKENCE